MHCFTQSPLILHPWTLKNAMNSIKLSFSPKLQSRMSKVSPHNAHGPQSPRNPRPTPKLLENQYEFPQHNGAKQCTKQGVSYDPSHAQSTPSCNIIFHFSFYILHKSSLRPQGKTRQCHYHTMLTHFLPTLCIPSRLAMSNTNSRLPTTARYHAMDISKL